MTRGRNRAPGVALMVLCFSLPATSLAFDVSREDVRQFIDNMVRRHHFHRDDLNALLTEAQSQPRILETIQKPAERTLAWWEYRQRFLTSERIEGGAQLWRQHAEALTRIAAQSGVPAEYLVAITARRAAIACSTHYPRWASTIRRARNSSARNWNSS
jgi:membrane-bound lytic murein transglycosylase B